MVKLIQKVIGEGEVFIVIERKNANLDTNVVNVPQVNKTVIFRAIFSAGNHFYLSGKKSLALLWRVVYMPFDFLKVNIYLEL